jgi:ATP-dependent helicase Lhr and Lhr-like helicase
MPLSAFSPRVREWFAAAFAAPTPAQEQAWPAIASGEHVLISAPTGSGKTLAAFLWGIDRLTGNPLPAGNARHTRLVYVSPLKALSYDIERNLRAPLRGVSADPEAVRVAIRTGDTPRRERSAMARTPPDILITTPESLYLILTSQAREMLTGVEAVIVDEIHAVASTKRGAHLALTLERLDEQARAGDGRGVHDVQRIGLSATQTPLEEPLPGRPATPGAAGGRRLAQAARPTHQRAGRVDGRARSTCRRGRGRPVPCARGRPARAPHRR